MNEPCRDWTPTDAAPISGYDSHAQDQAGENTGETNTNKSFQKYVGTAKTNRLL